MVFLKWSHRFVATLGRMWVKNIIEDFKKNINLSDSCCAVIVIMQNQLYRGTTPRVDDLINLMLENTNMEVNYWII